MATLTLSEQETRFWARVQRGAPDECWEWQGTCPGDGYGQVRWNGAVVGAHRIAFALAHRPLEPGEMVLHRCDNPPCCNPAHLRPGTAADNTADMVAKGRHVVQESVAPQLLALLREAGPLTVQAVASGLGLNLEVTRRRLNRLAADGQVQKRWVREGHASHFVWESGDDPDVC